MATFTVLTRKDLRSFDSEAEAMILDAIEEGCTGRVSSRGHALLRNAAGGTVSISRTMSAPNRTAQNARSNYKQFMAAHMAARRPAAPPLGDQQEALTRTGRAQMIRAYNRWPEKFNSFMQANQDLDMYEDVGVRVDGDQVTFVAVRSRQTPTEEVPVQEVSERKKRKLSKRRTQPDPELPGLVPVPDGWKPYYKGTGYDATPYAVNEAGTRWFCRWPDCNTFINQSTGLGGHQRGHVKQRRDAEAALRKASGLQYQATPAKPEEYLPVAPPLEPVDQQVRNAEEAVKIVDQIRGLIGPDRRVVELEATIVALTEERDAAVKHAEELDAKVSLLRETLSL